MPVVAIPDVGIPFPVDTTPEELSDFREKAKAFVRTIEELEVSGLAVSISDEDRAVSHQMLAEQKTAPARSLTPGAIKHLDAILSEYDREVLDVHSRLRNYVTNKLIMETVDPDAKVRLKALELLGKTTGVGAFSERVDVNVTHRTVQDIEAEIRKTLQIFDGDYAEVSEPTPTPSLSDIDSDGELSPIAPTEQDGPEAAT